MPHAELGGDCDLALDLAGIGGLPKVENPVFDGMAGAKNGELARRRRRGRVIEGAERLSAAALSGFGEADLMRIKRLGGGIGVQDAWKSAAVVRAPGASAAGAEDGETVAMGRITSPHAGAGSCGGVGMDPPNAIADVNGVQLRRG